MQDIAEQKHAVPEAKTIEFEYFGVASKKAASVEISATYNKYNDGLFLPPMTTWCSQLLFERLVMYQEMQLAKCSDSQNSIWKENKSKQLRSKFLIGL